MGSLAIKIVGSAQIVKVIGVLLVGEQDLVLHLRVGERVALIREKFVEKSRVDLKEIVKAQALALSFGGSVFVGVKIFSHVLIEPYGSRPREPCMLSQTVLSSL